MKRIIGLSVLVFFVGLIFSMSRGNVAMAAEETTISMPSSLSPTPWYQKLDYTLKNGYRVKYDLASLPSEIVFYDVYSLKKIGKEEIKKYKSMDGQSEAYFLKFLLKEEIYRVDTNGDNVPDVIHRISYLPTVYLKEEYCKAWRIGTGTMQGFLDFIRLAREKGIDMGKATIQRESQIIVNVKVDCPPYDGKMDIIIGDTKHPASSFEKSYGGDGIPDDEVVLKHDPIPAQPRAQKMPAKLKVL